jgi:hypothetical protein
MKEAKNTCNFGGGHNWNIQFWGLKKIIFNWALEQRIRKNFLNSLLAIRIK